MARARKIQFFLSQPFHVAEQFTGLKGKYVTIADTIKGFKEIVDGKHDDVPEQAFYMVGTIEEVLAASEKFRKESGDTDVPAQPAHAQHRDARASARPGDRGRGELPGIEG